MGTAGVVLDVFGELGIQVVVTEDHHSVEALCSCNTRIWLEVRDGTTSLRRLAAQSGCSDLYLRRVEPCLDCSWYRLDLSGPGGTGPTVLARVKRYESKAAWVSWAASPRWRRRRGEQRHGWGTAPRG